MPMPGTMEQQLYTERGKREERNGDKISLLSEQPQDFTEFLSPREILINMLFVCG